MTPEGLKKTKDVVRAADFSTDITIGKSYVRPVLGITLGLFFVWLGLVFLVSATREVTSYDLVLPWLFGLLSILLGSFKCGSDFTILFFTDCFMEITDEGVRWHRLGQKLVPWSAFERFEVCLSPLPGLFKVIVGITVTFNGPWELDRRWPYWQLGRKAKKWIVDIRIVDLAASKSFMVDALNAGLGRYRTSTTAKT